MVMSCKTKVIVTILKKEIIRNKKELLLGKRPQYVVSFNCGDAIYCGLFLTWRNKKGF